MPTAFALLGPTASGKSALALAAAQKVALEIVSVDSAQVYRGMDIGTAKPTGAEQAAVRHHLIDLAAPDEPYSTGRFRRDAVRAIQEILARGKLPLLVGGTMLYYRSLASGLDELPGADPALRAELAAEAAVAGWPALHARLQALDPDSARRIMPNDAQRIQRALEVFRLTGAPLSTLQRGAPAALPFTLRACALVPERAVLHAAIEQRFDDMLRRGLVEELVALRARYRLSEDLPSMRAVGYRQVWAYLEGRCDRQAMRAEALAATRQLAKRQVTWLRSFPDMLWLDAASAARAETDLHRLLGESG